MQYNAKSAFSDLNNVLENFFSHDSSGKLAIGSISLFYGAIKEEDLA